MSLRKRKNKRRSFTNNWTPRIAGTQANFVLNHSNHQQYDGEPDCRLHFFFEKDVYLHDKKRHKNVAEIIHSFSTFTTIFFFGDYFSPI